MSQQEVISEAISIMFFAVLGLHCTYFILLAVFFLQVFLRLCNISLEPLKSTFKGAPSDKAGIS